ncbi:hypothetical protein JYU34_019113 [Plutella xylostella]|uniref:Uncharacterized protein n=1 Tax=Plutella xylostella TaxID=51655 RepID=A0ABQ7PW75_PLUXY|nr:hypothetical protein JYU34_019113 [Plutella xylostella]
MYWIHGFLLMLLQLSFIEAQPTRANHGIQDNVAHKGFNAKNILKYLPPHLVKELQQSSKSHNPIAIFTAGDFSMDSPDYDSKDEIYERNGPIPDAGSEENSLKYDESNEIYYDDDRNDEPDMDADYSTSSNEMSELRRVRRNSDALVHTRPVRTLALLNTVSNVARSATEGHSNDKTLEIMFKLSRALQTYLADIKKDESVTLDIKKKSD